MLKISLLLGLLAALADVAGGLVLVRAQGVERYLRYFVALGAGFLMATALVEMAPESLRLSPRLGPILIMAGYCVVHLLDGRPTCNAGAACLPAVDAAEAACDRSTAGTGVLNCELEVGNRVDVR